MKAMEADYELLKAKIEGFKARYGNHIVVLWVFSVDLIILYLWYILCLRNNRHTITGIEFIQNKLYSVM